MSEIYHDANGAELHIGDAVRAIPDAGGGLWVANLEHGIITELYEGIMCRINMQEFRRKADEYKRGVRAAQCRLVVKIDDAAYNVAPSTSLLRCLEHI